MTKESEAAEPGDWKVKGYRVMDIGSGKRVTPLSKGLVGALAASLILALIAYGGGLLELANRWMRQEEYSHGFFIPLIALWLLWKRRDALTGSLGRPSWVGLGLLIVSTGMLLLGELVAIFLLIQAGFIVALVGIVLCVGGFSLLRIALLPIALLVFAIPMPYFVDAQLSWRLQLLSSQLGVDMLRLVGVSVFLEGNIIDLGVYKLQVVEACSGLRYLYPLLSIGFLMAYMYRAPFWQRAVIFMSTVPITVLMNSARIAIVGVLVQRWGTGMAEGFLHYFEGWIIFIACLAVLLGEIWIFERIGRKRQLLDTLEIPIVRAVSLVAKRESGAGFPMLAALVLLGGAAMAVQALERRDELMPDRESFASFPLALQNWQARESFLSREVQDVLKADDYLLADYRGEGGDLVNLYVAYYGSQRKGVSPHSPQVCIPGGGWTISDLSRRSVTVAGASSFPINRVVIDREGQRQLVYYWFEQRGRRIANEYWMKVHLLNDALVRNRTDGALVRLVTPVLPSEPLEAADRRLQSFVELAVVQLTAYVPQ